jgi:hypothetical protein
VISQVTGNGDVEEYILMLEKRNKGYRAGKENNPKDLRETSRKV